MPGGFTVDIMKCSFCPWKADGHQSGAVAAWQAHMAAAHPVYWGQRNAVADAIAGRGTYDTGYAEARGRLAQIVLAALGLTPDITGEGTQPAPETA
jgi:hypothetical protein